MKGVASAHRTTALSTALLYNEFNNGSMYTQLIGYLHSPNSSQHTTWGFYVCPGAVFWLSDWLPQPRALAVLSADNHMRFTPD